MTKIVFFEFAGRTANMAAQRPHIEALLAQNPDSEFHLWDLTRKRHDATYIREWAKSHPQIKVIDHLHPGHPFLCKGPRRRGHPRCVCMIHKPPYEQPYKWYRDQVEHVIEQDFSGSTVIDDYVGPYDNDTVFVKFDDDVIWMDVPRFPEVIEFLETHPNAVASANVANNSVCAKYEPNLHLAVREAFGIGGHLPQYDKDWWWLHTETKFAELSLRWLYEHNIIAAAEDAEPVRPRPGEKVSINFIAMKFPTLVRAANMMREGRLGDEGTVDSMLPWIIPNFRVAHLSFGPQEKNLSENDLARLRGLFNGQ